MDNQKNSSTPSATSHQTKKSNSIKGLIAGMVVCAILAVAGVGFGVYGMLQTNSKSSEIAELKLKISDQNQKLNTIDSSAVSTSGSDTEISDSANAYLNPVIDSVTTSNKLFFPSYQSPNLYPDGYTATYVYMQLQNGELYRCSIVASGTSNPSRDCSITGLSGPVYKIVTSGQGQSYGGEVAFIMADGTVQYANLNDVINSGTASIQGTYNIDGNVVDAIQADVQFTDSPVGGYGTTLFVLSNGSVVDYSDIAK